MFYCYNGKTTVVGFACFQDRRGSFEFMCLKLIDKTNMTTNTVAFTTERGKLPKKCFGFSII